MKRYKLTMSPTMLQRIATCETQAALASLDYVGSEPSVPAEVGRVMHATFAARLLNGAPFDWNAITEWCDSELYAKLVVEEKLDDDFTGENLIRIATEWERRHLVESELPFAIEGVERPFDFKLWEFSPYSGVTVDVHIAGYMDTYGHDEAGDLYVGEWKFTRKRIDDMFKRNYQMDPQNGAYIWALAKLTGKHVMGSYVGAVSMAKLPDDPTRKCRTDGVPYSECGHLHLKEQLFLVNRTSEDLADWERGAMALAEDYFHVLMEVNEYQVWDGPLDLTGLNMRGLFIKDACNWCDFREFCRLHRPVDQIDTLLRRVTRDKGAVRSGLEVLEE